MNYYCPRDGNVTFQLFGGESILLLCFFRGNVEIGAGTKTCQSQLKPWKFGTKREEQLAAPAEGEWHPLFQSVGTGPWGRGVYFDPAES